MGQYHIFYKVGNIVLVVSHLYNLLKLLHIHFRKIIIAIFALIGALILSSLFSVAGLPLLSHLAFLQYTYMNLLLNSL